MAPKTKQSVKQQITRNKASDPDPLLKRGLVCKTQTHPLGGSDVAADRQQASHRHSRALVHRASRGILVLGKPHLTTERSLSLTTTSLRIPMLIAIKKYYSFH